MGYLRLRHRFPGSTISRFHDAGFPRRFRFRHWCRHGFRRLLRCRQRLGFDGWWRRRWLLDNGLRGRLGRRHRCWSGRWCLRGRLRWWWLGFQHRFSLARGFQHRCRRDRWRRFRCRHGHRLGLHHRYPDTPILRVRDYRAPGERDPLAESHGAGDRVWLVGELAGDGPDPGLGSGADPGLLALARQHPGDRGFRHSRRLRYLSDRNR